MVTKRYFGIIVNEQNTGISPNHSVEDVVALLEKIDGEKICVGNPDERFVSLTEMMDLF